MLPTEQTRFFAIVQNALGAYTKTPTQTDLEAWWRECKSMTLDALEAAFKAHRQDADRGERAPRPVDITRRMKAGTRDAARCSATDPTGQCQYPGIFSEGTGGEGPWYCPWHRMDKSGAEASRWIERSKDVPYVIAMSRREARMYEESIRAPAVVELAWNIAKRHGYRPWQAPLVLPFNGELSADEKRLAAEGQLEDAA